MMWQVGEKVYVDGKYGNTGYIAQIDRITPSGRLVVGELQYRQDGHQWGADKFSHGMIRKLTPDLIARVNKDGFAKQINACRNRITALNLDNHVNRASEGDMRLLLDAWRNIENITKRITKND